MTTTKYYTGSDCTGIDGALNRTLTLPNTLKTKSSNFLVYASGLLLSTLSSYSVVHNTTGTIVTFLNALFNDMELIVIYETDFSVGAVNYGNLFSRPRANVENLIKDNVSDPVTSSSEHRKWVYTREPDTKSSDFKGFPFIIIHPATLDFDGRTVNGQLKTALWGIQIEVITSDREFNNSDGNGATHLDSISDEIVNVLNNSTNSNTLRTVGLFFVESDATSVVVEPFNNTLIYRRSFMLSLKNKMKVYA